MDHVKEVTRVYHPNDVNTIRFSVKKMNNKNYKAMSQNQRLAAAYFIQDCINDLERFRNELIQPIEAIKTNPQ